MLVNVLLDKSAMSTVVLVRASIVMAHTLATAHMVIGWKKKSHQYVRLAKLRHRATPKELELKSAIKTMELVYAETMLQGNFAMNAYLMLQIILTVTHAKPDTGVFLTALLVLAIRKEPLLRFVLKQLVNVYVKVKVLEIRHVVHVI